MFGLLKEQMLMDDRMAGMSNVSEGFWMGKKKIRTPGRSGGCKYYCDRQNLSNVRPCGLVSLVSCALASSRSLFLPLQVLSPN
eukprot:768191-Hanusia_phi.AAC.4